jgi:hypothetical protein
MVQSTSRALIQASSDSYKIVGVHDWLGSTTLYVILLPSMSNSFVIVTVCRFAHLSFGS